MRLDGRKAIDDVTLDADGVGTFRAAIATFDVVDHDGDVTLAGAFKNGQAVRIAQWGHNWGVLPSGRGTLDSDAKHAWVDGKFFLNTTHGKDTYETVKQLADLQEWSHGYDVVDGSTDASEVSHYDGAVRILKALDLVEVSPVMLAAGIGTRTENIKGGDGTLAARLDRMAADTPVIIEHARASVTMRGKSGRVLSAANRTRLSALAEAWTTGLSELNALLRDTDASATDDESKARSELALMRIGELRAEARRLGVAV